jgi:pyruvate/2-oxoglutarate dehydrogenase complex dihydrolipoamide acyltransferase (E2) component
MPQVPIRIPDLGTEIARVSMWLVDEGEAVNIGDRVLEIVIPGATVDVHAPVTGRLETRILFPTDRVQHGMIAGMLFTPDDV